MDFIIRNVQSINPTTFSVKEQEIFKHTQLHNKNGTIGMKAVITANEIDVRMVLTLLHQTTNLALGLFYSKLKMHIPSLCRPVRAC